MKKITVAVPTYNEQENLPRLLDSLDFADQVLIVDSGSEDKTVEIAKSYGADVVHHQFKNFADTRNFADQKADNQWILSVDADVQVPSSLAEEIASLPSKPAAYKIGRINIIWGKPILHTDWGPRDDNHIRLYHKSLGKWQAQVHEQFITNVKPESLDNYLIHYNYSTVSEYIRKLNHYSTLQAQRLHQNGERFSLFCFFIDPVMDFSKRYFYKLGFLDGLHGLFLSILQAIYHQVVQVKLYTLSN